MRRVVVTGLGMVTPLGCGVDVTWSNLLAGKSGIGRITDFEVDDLACQIAGQVPRGSKADGKFNPDDWMEPKESRKVDHFIIYAMAAADQALDDAGLASEDARGPDRDRRPDRLRHWRPGGIDDAAITLRDRGPRRISPFFIPGRLINLASGQVSIRHQLEGPEPFRGHRLLDRRARDRRRRAADRARRRRRDGRGRHGVARLPTFDGRLRRLQGAVHRTSTIARPRPRVPTIATATVSSWARAPVSSSSRSASTRSPAARRSMAR